MTMSAHNIIAGLFKEPVEIVMLTNRAGYAVYLKESKSIYYIDEYSLLVRPREPFKELQDIQRYRMLFNQDEPVLWC